MNRVERIAFSFGQAKGAADTAEAALMASLRKITDALDGVEDSDDADQVRAYARQMEDMMHHVTRLVSAR